MLTVTNLTLELPDRVLLDQIHFTAERGSVWHITGANGVGKTTLLRALTGLKPLAHGTIEWLGQNIQTQLSQFWQQLQVVGHLAAIKPRLTMRENCRFNFNTPVPDSQVDLALEKLALTALADQFAGQCSAGQQRRIALARLLLKPASLWLLDEPYTALDQESTAIVNDLIETHAEEGGVVIFTSHRDPQFERRQAHRLELRAPC